ncbi:hypothetical protein FSP39_003148 [Pinctada imbricata]|uniref:Potassium channel tetramerisation-type BTB domain-containing protein n=1 Tax=Pinctada imbricata TaxID=66713 RepID=A0AA89BSE6_PINIB|nr:hypothetical protein FSP39_003148 [Pinctada imbricata]
MINHTDVSPMKTTPDGIAVYFLDRDPEFFPVVLHFLRDGPMNIQCHLPIDPVSLRKIHMEAIYYGLFKLSSIVAHRMCNFLMGSDTFSPLEE